MSPRWLRLPRRRARRESPPKVVFALSAPRSGSTWLRTALGRHPEVLATENRLFGDFFEMWSDERGAAPRMTLDYYARYLGAVQDAPALGLDPRELREENARALAAEVFAVLARLSGRRVIVDKVTPYLDTADAVVAGIRRCFPEAQIVRLVRDGRDVATSGAFDWLRKDARGTARHAWFVEGRRDRPLERFFDDAVLQRWARYWVQPLRALAAPAWTVRYEELLADPARTLAGCFARLGVDAAPRVVERCVAASSFERMSGGRRPGEMVATAKVRRGVAGDWRNYFTRADGELFHELAGAELRELGYEPDGSWVQDLPEKLLLAGGQGA